MGQRSDEDVIMKMVSLMERMLEMQDSMVRQLERVTDQVEELQKRLNEENGLVAKNRLN